jgi:hypothetical protein
MLWLSAASRGSLLPSAKMQTCLRNWPAVVEQVTAHMRQFGEHLAERFADGVAARGQRTVGHQFAQPTGEMEFGHRAKTNSAVVPAKAGTQTSQRLSASP